MDKASEKGRALENATRSIHELLLRKNGLTDETVVIEPNYQFKAGGARNEIDILVRINPDSPNERRQLFECKNRKTKVSKNDIIILADKVRRLKGEKGTMVARSFTRDALALATHESIEIERVIDDRWLSDELIGITDTSFMFHSIILKLHRYGNEPTLPEPNWSSAKCTWKSQPLDFGEFIRDSIHDEMKSKPGTEIPFPGMACRHARANFNFDQNQLWVGDWNIAQVNAEFDYSNTHRVARLESSFSIERKGRFAEFVFEPHPLNDDDLRIEFIGKA